MCVGEGFNSWADIFGDRESEYKHGCLAVGGGFSVREVNIYQIDATDEEYFSYTDLYK